MSKRVRQEQPICAVPGCTRPSRAADHITPVRLGGGFLDRENLQGLCWSHHQSKSAKEKHQKTGKQTE
ncbi:HNH endonuclease [Hymenobacter sp. BT175]|nr:HNH endonuclease [Hymenobacter translucens]